MSELNPRSSGGIQSSTMTTERPWARWAPRAVRLVLGCGFMVHGWAKLSRGPGVGFAKLLAWTGTPFPVATAWVSTLMELLGGLALVLGAFVEVVSVPL